MSGPVSRQRTLSERIAEAVAVVRRGFIHDVEVGIVLGTGLGGLADRIEVEAAFDYAELPGFAWATVESHHGNLIVGRLGSRSVVAMQGRLHRYEGYSLGEVTFPIRVMRALGAGTLVVSNVSGGIDPSLAEGDLALITDHINLIGDNPLVGMNQEELGPRFPDMSEAYDAGLRRLAMEMAAELGIALRSGVYAAVSGPSLETPAEWRMLRAMGADLVGMSTVPEVIAAVHGGMKVFGISIVSNVCDPESPARADIERILAVARWSEPSLTALVEAVLERHGG